LRTYSAPIETGLTIRGTASRGARAALAAIAIAIGLLSGCGDSGSSDSDSDVHRAPAAERSRFIAAADPICRRAVRETAALKLTPSTAPNANILTPTTEGLVRPGVPILTREAARLRALRPRPDDSDLRKYLGLFDPILVLAEERLRLGESKTPTIEQARALENDIVELENAQATYATSFGFKVCGTGFFDALTSNPTN
jgi:hypothetical protein